MTAPDFTDMEWGWRVVQPDFTSQHGYRWPYPGSWAEAPGPILIENDGACPLTPGDGICVARNWSGAASGGVSARNPVLVVGWYPSDLLGESPDKVRVRRAYVADVISVEQLLKRAPGANLRGADLGGANLSGANLRYANLRGADLRGANLVGADLVGADLVGADLGYANLRYANLRHADLGYANLRHADLHGADLRYANLRHANLVGANLRCASVTAEQASLLPARWKRSDSGLVVPA